MKILGCDLHAKQQTIAMVDRKTGEFTEKTLSHEGNEVREFYAALEGPVVVGIEATGAMQWFLELLDELGIVCRVGFLHECDPSYRGLTFPLVGRFPLNTSAFFWTYNRTATRPNFLLRR